jgi:hypothetical protein
VNDGHEVFSKLGLLWRFSMIFAVNNEFDPKSSEQEFKEVKRRSDKVCRGGQPQRFQHFRRDNT